MRYTEKIDDRMLRCMIEKCSWGGRPLGFVRKRSIRKEVWSAILGAVDIGEAIWKILHKYHPGFIASHGCIENLTTEFQWVQE